MSARPRNWAGNITFRAGRMHRPGSLAELRRVVGAADAVRVLGTGHSFNRVADADGGDQVVLDALPASVDVDTAAGTAEVAAGMRLAEIAPRLQAAGFALPSLPSLPHISPAGACATGTHGSGDGLRGLAALVRAMRLVGPEGDVTELSRDGSEDFAGCVVSLGALGVVTHLTLDLVPAFDVAQHVWTRVPLDRVFEHFDEVFSAGYSVSVFTDWTDTATVWVKLHAAQSDDIALPPRDDDWLGGRLADRPVHPIPGLPAENCTEQLGVPGPWHERLPHFRPEFTPSSGEELQSEFFLARDRAQAAFAAVRALGARIAPVLLVSEIRTIAADDLWLSPCFERDSVAIHFTWIADRAAVAPVLAAVEHELLPLGARPHWGKVFSGGPDAALATYEKADEFDRILRRHDPRGKFRNQFVRDLFPDHH
ncbi:D-arabinono-1,4-lactone oxidase [Catenulispora subtropica]|uniref:Alditol oxidase n=1 Tax=Catenulispora subtropica TaxID=450798 RepID=A0ABN2REE3_9ACTN